MANCELFGKSFTIPDSYIRDYIMKTRGWEASEAAEKEFNEWYEKCIGIDGVMKGYDKIASSLMEKYAFEPLFKQLASLGIYDVSEDMYIRQVIDFGKIDDAYGYVEADLEEIIEDKNEMMQYRAARKASRGRFVGGGFGVAGAIKGSMKAGALNATTGLAHGAVNTIGNIGSSIGASVKKSALYNNDTRETLCTGIYHAIGEAYKNHMELVNEHTRGYYEFGFDPDGALALFENAKKFPAKREELLFEAVQYSPKEESILSYIFINYPNEKKNVYKIGQLFEMDFGKYIEESFAKSYTDSVKNDIKKAEELKAEIAQTMKEFGIKTSTTFDQIEKDCIKSLCGNIDVADEERCNSLKQKVAEYDALDKNKKEVFDEIQARLEAIWSKEDGEIFDNIYMNTNIYDQVQVNEAIRYIKQKGRTASSQKYITALESCNQKNIEKAKKYQAKSAKTYNTIGIILLLLGIVCIFVTPPAVVISIPGIIIMIDYSDKRRMWKILTIDETQIHSMLLTDKPIGTMSGPGPVSMLVPVQQASKSMVCPFCGTEIDRGIFCPECGTRCDTMPNDNNVRATTEIETQEERQAMPNDALTRPTETKTVFVIVGIGLAVLVGGYMLIIWDAASQSEKSGNKDMVQTSNVVQEDPGITAEAGEENIDNADTQNRNVDSNTIDLTVLMESKPESEQEMVAGLESYGIDLSYDYDSQTYKNLESTVFLQYDDEWGMLFFAMFDPKYSVYGVTCEMSYADAYDTLLQCGETFTTSDVEDNAQWFDVNGNGVLINAENSQVGYIFVLVDGANLLQEQQNVEPVIVMDPVSTYTGTWWDTYSQRCNMEITTYDGIVYNININWSSSAFENTEWVLSGTYDETTGGIRYQGSMIEENSLDGGEIQETYVYTDGEGLIWIGDDGMLYWDDYVDQQGANCAFEKDQDENLYADLLVDEMEIPLLEIAGGYSGIYMEGCSISMYTSIDDEAVGNIQIYCSDGIISGELINLATNVFQVLTTDGREIVFGVYTDNETICLDLYMDGVQTDYLTMYIHYRP